MCKLCNTPEPPRKIKTNVAKIKLFEEVTIAYTGESPCIKCLQAFNGKVSKRVTEDDMDKYILTKLYKRYRPFKSKASVPGYIKNTYVHSSTLGIEIITNTITGAKSYRAGVNGNRGKCYNTFEEAMNKKLELLSTGAHPQSLKRLQNKLKEIQNEKR